MKKNVVWLIIVINLFFSLPLLSQTLPPLKVAADTFSPPFVMRGMNNQLYGFDVDMMEHICQRLKRTCVYYPMRFDYLIPKVQANAVDVAIGSITITLERSKQVAFSIPYLLSYAQYIGLKDKYTPNFSTKDLANQKVGVEFGSIFKEALDELNMPNIQIIESKNFAALMEALQSKRIDYAIVDASTAQYWKIQSNDQIVPLGRAFLFGYGFGIAVNLNNPALLEDINSALLEYQNSGGFQKAYNEYIARF